MKELPILFNPEMVRAILSGQKTQTRRVLNPQPFNLPEGAYCDPYNRNINHFTFWTADNKMCVGQGGNVLMRGKRTCHWKSALGNPGDRLWVRETHYAYGHWTQTKTGLNKKGAARWKFISNPEHGFLFPGDKLPKINAMATEQIRTGKNEVGWFKRPGIFMPRSACRLILEITDLRVERLNDITEEDAIAEGVGMGIAPVEDSLSLERKINPAVSITRANGFQILWEKIYGRYSWKVNPWVWVISFKVVKPCLL